MHSSEIIILMIEVVHNPILTCKKYKDASLFTHFIEEHKS